MVFTKHLQTKEADYTLIVKHTWRSPTIVDLQPLTSFNYSSLAILSAVITFSLNELAIKARILVETAHRKQFVMHKWYCSNSTASIKCVQNMYILFLNTPGSPGHLNSKNSGIKKTKRNKTAELG